MKNAILRLSGGVTSWAAGRRHIDRNGKDGFAAVFADTQIEDEKYIAMGEEAF